MQQTTPPNRSRRDILKFASIVASLGAGSVVSTTPALAGEKPNEATRGRYQANSDHVKIFYQVNRYPS